MYTKQLVPFKGSKAVQRVFQEQIKVNLEAAQKNFKLLGEGRGGVRMWCVVLSYIYKNKCEHSPMGLYIVDYLKLQ